MIRRVHSRVVSGMKGLLMVSVLVLFVAVPRDVAAAWPVDPASNLPLCTAPGEQDDIGMISDGGGGAFIAWQDQRTPGDYGIYVSHVSPDGGDFRWPANGLATFHSSNPNKPGLVTDGAGGVLVVGASNYREVRVSRLLGDGTRDPLWPALGTWIADTGLGPTITSDGIGGALIAWSGESPDGIVVQHVLSTGNIDPQWPPTGLQISPLGVAPTIVGDGSGGCIVSWLGATLFAQHVEPNGIVDATWPVSGRAITTPNPNGNGYLYDIKTVSDGVGGVYYVWTDSRGGFRVRAQHLTATGGLAPGWMADGMVIASGANRQDSPSADTDAAGGLFVAWSEIVSTTASFIRAQHIVDSGVGDPAWPTTGILVSAGTSGIRTNARIVRSVQGGAIVCWSDYDYSVGNFDVISTHLTSGGNLAPNWPSSGVGVSLAAGDQGSATAYGKSALCGVAQRAGGAIMAWRDTRNGNSDIFAQRILEDGALGGGVLGVVEFAGDASPLAIEPIYFSPWPRDRLIVKCSCTPGVEIAVSVVNVLGREMTQSVSWIPRTGHETAVVGGGGRIPSGRYWLIARQGHARALQSVVVAR